MLLHRASCRMIRQYMKNMSEDAFTGRDYIKVCSNSASDIVVWIKSHGGTTFTKLCAICTPRPEDDVSDELDLLRMTLASAVKASQNGSHDKRMERLAKASRRPEMMIVQTRVFKRNPDVIAETLARAAGVCERCAKPAPFYRASDASPYLEVHHIIQLSEGGDDTVDNAIAACPNCHREAHFG
ncbi:MAG: hypothetical protein EOP21_00540 [Hyphomicrobiales bacterium]|nr:MAG: hypothetical protein EOP21_00540 [Hyphomicrobiales bacterium]